MPRSTKTATKTAREYLVRTADDRDYARDPHLDACKQAANVLGAGAYVVALDEQLIPFGEPVYTVPDPDDDIAPELPQLDGSERARDHAADAVQNEPEQAPELSPQAAAIVRNAQRAKQGKRPQDLVLNTEDEGQTLVFAGGCACGCGEDNANIKSGKSRFIQGHDQRLVGILALAYSAGQQASWRTADAGEFVGDALQYGARVFSDYGMAKLRRACFLPAAAAQGPESPSPEQQTDDSPGTTVAPDPHTAALLPGDEIKVKIGRHERYARIHGMSQAGKVTAVRYATVKDPSKEVITEKFTIID